jgi:hypothetical protein
LQALRAYRRLHRGHLHGPCGGHACRWQGEEMAPLPALTPAPHSRLHTPHSPTLHTPPHSTLPHTLPTRHPPTRHPATQPRLTSLTSLTSRGISCGTRTMTRSTSPSRRLPRHRNPPPLDHPLTTP